MTVDGKSLGCCQKVPGIDPRLVQKALLGPAITLALALQRTFCLHASAVEVPSGIIAFAGESGSGKSTLARRLFESRLLGRRRAADDLLAIEVESDRPTAHLDFPQLKLAPADQPYTTGPSTSPLRAVYVLERPASSDHRREVRIEMLTPKHSILGLIRHTVASRLFDATLLENQVDASATIATRIPVSRLTFPWEAGCLPRIAEAIADKVG